MRQLVDLAVGVDCRALSDRRLAVVVLVRAVRGGVMLVWSKTCENEKMPDGINGTEVMSGRVSQPLSAAQRAS